jgi:integrase
MAKGKNLLKPLQIQTLGKGKHRDAPNLYLQVDERAYTLKSGEKRASISRKFVYRYSRTIVMEDGTKQVKTHNISLGPVDKVSLAEARDRAKELDYQRFNFEDPATIRKQRKAAAKLETVKGKSLKDVADERIAIIHINRKNDRSKNQWTNSLRDHVHPHIGHIPVADISKADILSVLNRIWYTNITTANRVRQRLADILRYATASGYRPEGLPNHAEWKGNLEYVLPSPDDVKQKNATGQSGFTAVPHQRMNELVLAMQGEGPSLAAKCLLLIGWTACRSSEARGAKWSEFDLDGGVWTVSAARMKNNKERRVPLPPPLMQMLQDMPRSPHSDLVFPSSNDTPISDVLINNLMEKHGFGDYTIHGLRKAFKSWGMDYEKNREAIEVQLSHELGNRVERAYIDTDMFDVRAELMTQWCEYTLTKRDQAARVTDIKTRKAL